MVAPVGSDVPPDVTERIRAAGLSAAGLSPKPLPTLRNRVAYGTDGNRTWTLFATGDEFHALSPCPGDIPASYLDAAAFLVLAMTLPAQQELICTFKARTRGIIAITDVFLPSAEEVGRPLGHEDWDVAARTFAAWGRPSWSSSSVARDASSKSGTGMRCRGSLRSRSARRTSRVAAQ